MQPPKGAAAGRPVCVLGYPNPMADEHEQKDADLGTRPTAVSSIGSMPSLGSRPSSEVSPRMLLRKQTSITLSDGENTTGDVNAYGQAFGRMG